jgi:sugar (pentulose or hexulose) kinase
VRGLEPSRFDVQGVAAAAQLGVVLVDAEGNPTEDALLWPDTRAVEEARELERQLGTAQELIGRKVAAELPAAKMLWWSRHRADAVSNSRWILSIKDFLVLRMTGAAVTDETHASYTGWFDVNARSYTDDLLLRTATPREFLPPVASALTAAGPLSARAAAQMGLQEGVVVAVGAPDGTAGALGAGAVEPHTTVDVAGTTDVLVHVLDEAPTGGGHAVANAFAVPKLWTLGGPTGMTGGAVEWVSRLLGYSSAAEAFSDCGKRALEVGVGSDGVSFSPSLSGSRMPTWDSSERGLLSGLGLHHSPAHVLRAAYEGAAFLVLEGLDALRSAGAVVDEVTVVGGVARQRDLVQLRSDLWEIPVRVLDGDEATSVGTAMLAGIAAGVFDDAAKAANSMVASSTVIEPRIRNDRLAARARWQQTSAAARELF